jgi:hypothetical protein
LPPLLLLSLLQLLRRTWLRLLLTQLRRHARADGKQNSGAVPVGLASLLRQRPQQALSAGAESCTHQLLPLLLLSLLQLLRWTWQRLRLTATATVEAAESQL